MSWNACRTWTFYLFIAILVSIGFVEGVITSYILLRRYSIRYFVADLRIPIYFSYLITVLTIFTALFGWKSFKKTNPTLLKLFSILTAFTVTTGLAFCIWTFIEQQQLPRSTDDVLNVEFHFKGNNSKNWDVLQTEFQCCGIHGPVNYIQTHRPIPTSCCVRKSGTPFCGLIQQMGCLFSLSDALSNDFNWISLCLLIAALIQFPGIILTWKLSNILINSELPINVERLVEPQRGIN